MSEKENNKKRVDKSVEKIVDNMTLLDDDLMSMVFDGNVPATELVLKIILKRNDINVIKVMGQKELKILSLADATSGWIF